MKNLRPGAFFGISSCAQGQGRSGNELRNQLQPARDFEQKPFRDFVTLASGGIVIL
jgi:hypothetical protein